MPTAGTRRAAVWAESLGDWSWPGGAPAQAELLPPPWVPASPPALAAAGPAGPVAPVRPARSRRLLPAALLSCLVAAAAGVAAGGREGIERILGEAPAPVPAAQFARVDPHATYPPPLRAPALTPVRSSEAGSQVVSASWWFPSLHGLGSYLVYLPPGYSRSDRRYPVLYLLPGNSQSDEAFLQVGVQEELDSLIARHVVPPMIAVMIQGGPGANNWRNQGSLHYEDYVLEVQRQVDGTLPTIARRQARAIAGDSMGGYGAMNIALGNPYLFATVESWIGFFNGLEPELRADGPVIARLGMRAFVYGGASDRVADPSEDPWFAGKLRSAGAQAEGVIYEGGHSLQTVAAHIGAMLAFAGEGLAAGERVPTPSLLDPQRAARGTR